MATIKQAKNIILASFKSKVPVILYSAPGMAKSSLVKQITGTLNINFIDVRSSLTDVGDWQGLPISSIKDGQEVVKFLMSTFLPQDPNWEGVLFLDEITCVTKEVMNCLLQLILDRKIQNHYTLPDKCYIVLAANPFGHDNPVIELGGAFKARCCHINLEPTKEEWFEYAENNNVRDDVVYFAKLFPELLFPKPQKFDTGILESNFRTMEFLSKMMTALEQQGCLEECRLEVAMGIIGSNAGILYDSECKKNYGNIDPNQILKNYDIVQHNVKKLVDKGDVSEQTRLVTRILALDIFKDIINNETYLNNFIDFLNDLALDVKGLGLKQISETNQELVFKILQKNKESNSSRFSKLLNIFNRS